MIKCRYGKQWLAVAIGNAASFLYVPLLFFSCSQANEHTTQVNNNDTLKEHLVAANKIIVDNESSRIAEFIKRHQWKMDSTRTGLRYWIYSKGTGANPTVNNGVEINYKLFIQQYGKIH